MTTPQFQKTDSGMQGGVRAIDECLGTCRGVHTKVMGVRSQLGTEWTGVAGTTFVRKMDEWERNYNQILTMLGTIRDMVQNSDKEMTNTDDDIALTAVTAFGDASNTVFRGLT